MIRTIHLLKSITLSNFLRLKYPYKLTYAVTYRCNLKCKMCAIWKKDLSQELSLDEINRFFNKSGFFSWIDLTGGEIFLREDIFDILSIILNNCSRLKIIHFPTNGQFPEEALKFLMIVNKTKGVVPVVTVSIDGEEALSDDIRGVKGAWRNAVNTFKIIKESGCSFCSFGITISRYNVHYLSLERIISQVVKIYPDIDKSDFHFNIAHSSEHYYSNPSEENMFNDSYRVKLSNLLLLNNKNRIKGFLQNNYLSGINKILRNGEFMPCQSLSGTCFLNPEGYLYPCSIYNRRLSHIQEIDYDVRQYWENKDLICLYRDLQSGKCPKCWTPCEAFPSILGSILRKPSNIKKNILCRQSE